MIQNTVARRYAAALFQAAQDNGQLDEIMADFQLVLSFLRQEPRLGDILQHQRLSTRRKKELVRGLWETRVSRLFLNFLELIIDKRRERFLEIIYSLFAAQVRLLHNVAVAEVKVAYALDRQAELSLQQALERLTGKKIEMQISLHPELIGGLVVKIGDRIIDGSATKRLQLLGERLVDRSHGKLEVGT
ncbi:MAG: ATP synthase F1 subunit delta [Thermacetogeniaceae bacterium]